MIAADVGGVAAFVVLMGAALGVLAKWVVVPAWRASVAVFRGIKFVEHELTANSGKSLRDLMNRTERRFEFLFESLGIEMPEHLKAPTDEERP